ncbi:MAG: YkgJ family cysteine cluster protein [Candidatus Omnitrophica bacterium]|nr:YkgJ family cysteine cluster protein [Candidatus Omnitrophota bacterium]
MDWTMDFKQIIPSGLCLECRGCSRFSEKDSMWSPLLLDEEIEYLKGKNLLAGCDTKKKKLTTILNPIDENFVCAFLLPQDNSCRIYEFRPFECRLYPFLINRGKNKIYLAVDPHCLFIERNAATKQFQEYADYLAGVLKSPPWTRVINEIRDVIPEYQDVMNISEL